MKAIFTVHHQILSGLKYVQVVSRGPLKNKMQEMIVRVSHFIPHLSFVTTSYCKLTCHLLSSPFTSQGSYSPNTTEKPTYEKKFEPDTAPTGMLGRGKYSAVSKFVDDDKVTHLEFAWTFEIKKDW